MINISKTQSFVSTIAAVTAVFTISLAIGAGASHALVSTSAHYIKAPIKNASTGKLISFADARRLPHNDDAGAPVQPLFAFAEQARPLLNIAR